MPTPTIPDGKLFMNATLYTGNSSTQTINNVSGFYPDFNWIKRRNGSSAHVLVNSVAGGTKQLFSNTTALEQTNTNITNGISSSGIALGDNSSGTGDTNLSGGTYVLWQWLANAGTAVTNTAGTISSQVSANTTSGFSVVTWTGTGVAATIGHGLGVAPSWIVAKPRSNSGGWPVYHASLGNTGRLYLESTAGNSPSAVVWNSTSPTSTVFSVGTGTDANTIGYTYVGYCWTPIAGYSAFGSYTGNGSADGPFIYTGFRPKFFLTKRTNGLGDNWHIHDTSRSPFNAAFADLTANTSNAENTSSYPIDILSNGIKWRQGGSDGNESGATYIYMAFAENPFKYANAR
jgi:hypothetical protein